MRVHKLLCPALLLGLLAGLCPADEAVLSREEAQRQVLQRIERELAGHGSWEAWAQSLAPFRDHLRQVRGGPWPWPAQHNYVFQGREADLLLIDDLNQNEEGRRPLEGIVHLDRQLKARGIDLIFVIIPDKLTVFPDYLTDTAPADRNVALPVRRLMKELIENDVEVVDLFALYDQHRREHGDWPSLYYDRDSHWRNLGAQLAGGEIARRLMRYDFVQSAQRDGGDRRYTTREHRRDDGNKADDVLLVVERETGRAYSNSDTSPIVLTGDSFSMYNMHLNGHLPAHVALHIGMPLTYICREGMWGDMPVDIARAEQERQFLTDRRVVIWTLCARSLAAGRWPVVDLPGAPAAPDQQAAAATEATGLIAAASERPDAEPPYDNFIMRFHLRELADATGAPIADGDAVVRVLAMKDRQVLPAARLQPGQRLRLRLIDWSAVEAEHGGTMSGTLEDVQVEINRPHYWGELLAD